MKNNMTKQKKNSILFAALLAVTFLLPATAGLLDGGTDSAAAGPSVSDEVKTNPTNSAALSRMIKVYDVKADKVSEHDFEDYMVGVLAGEMPASYESEALKAQAVAGRSYILDRMENYRKNGAPAEHKGADICTDSAHCKAWLSTDTACEKWGADWAKNYLPKLQSAVQETRGEYMVYEGQTVKAFFYSTSSGKTETAHDVWGGNNYPYLQSVESVGDTTAPDFESSVTVSKEDFVQKLQTKNSSVIAAEPLSAMLGEITRTEGGSVASVTLGGQTFKGTEIRTLFGLRSANFTAEATENSVIFHVKGYGHGVGMSQYGANYMAKQGKTYKEILQHYYTGIEFSMLNYQN